MEMLKCLRCGWTWVKRIDNPRVCPNCISAYWDTPRINKIKILQK